MIELVREEKETDKEFNVKKMKIEGMINDLSKTQYEFQKIEDKYLLVPKNKDGEVIKQEKGSSFYSSEIDRAIKKKEESIYINIPKDPVTKKRFEVEGPGLTDAITRYEKDKVVRSFNVLVSGEDVPGIKSGAYDTEGKPLYSKARDIVMHEFVGHAIPQLMKDPKGISATSRENIVRGELIEAGHEDIKMRLIVPKHTTYKFYDQ